MTLLAGDINASDGMAKAIYDQMIVVLEPDLEGLAEDAKTPIRDNWKKLAFAIAKGVISHLENNLEIDQVKTGGSVNASVSGSTAAGGADSHSHSVSLTAVQNNVKWNQTSDGIGKVKK